MKYLLDTNTLSEGVKSVPDQSVLKMFEKHQQEIVTAAPVWHELQFGCHRLPRSRKRELMVNDLILVTRNVDDFKQFQGLQVDNWHTADL